ncbi:hypothetical protein [Bradyrhizobium australiense]|uniref:Uncharacterized protein n=1 Tax=Bradyrhizobium australiense TaxID=2721161 RepID=A0A7Y4GTH2_9BRAD|nr:hypothetical protein [Bradyrhizobium australiense]NOJ41690.1 hypothetical protein [Bradyrhizobium australiense]
MKTYFLPVLLSVLVTPSPAGAAQPLQVIGYSGYLGEWELTATVAETTSGSTPEYSGPLTMKHVGICTQDGPEEKTGALRFRISTASSRLNAIISVAGVECTYAGQLSDSYSGTMNCPGRQGVPLKLWVK